MDSYGWKTKTWNFKSDEESEQKRLEMKSWIKKWSRKYQIREIFANNAWAVQYRLLLHM